MRRGKNKNGKERKVRSDKKVPVGPTVTERLKREVERFAFIMDQPVQRLGELLVIEGIHNKDVTERFTPYFQRGVLRVGNTLYPGNRTNPSLRGIIELQPTDRISIRFQQKDYEDVRTLADLLDVSPSRATGLLIDESIRHPEIIESILHKHNNRMNFDEIASAELKKFVRFVNRDNPYKATDTLFKEVWANHLDFILMKNRAARK